MSFGNIYQQLRNLEQSLRVHLIRPELEIILALYFYGPLPAGELGRFVRCSSAGFGITKRKLVESRVLKSERSTSDRRSNIIDISTDVRGALENIFGEPAVRDPRANPSGTIFPTFDTEPGLDEPIFPIIGERPKVRTVQT